MSRPEGVPVNARLETALVAIVVAVLGIGWFSQYVMPKSATLMAAASCLSDKGLSLDSSAQSEAAWDVCLEGAEKTHATPLLLALGY